VRYLVTARRDGACRYGLVGETVVVALWIGHSYFALYPRDRIAVRRGDVIGIYFPRYNPIPWSTVDCRRGNAHLFKYNPYSVTMVLAGQRDVVFDTGRQDWNPCRAYSVNATIMRQLGIARIPRRRHRHRLAQHGYNLTSYHTLFPREDPREDVCVGVDVGIVECQLITTDRVSLEDKAFCSVWDLKVKV